MGLGRVYLGSRRQAWRKYIRKVLTAPSEIDRRILFVTYVGLNRSELDEIREEIEKRVSFDRIIYQKASAAIAVNCGPGTFGLLYIRK